MMHLAFLFHSSFTPVMSNEPLSVIYPSLQQFMFCNSLSFFFLFAFRAQKLHVSISCLQFKRCVRDKPLGFQQEHLIVLWRHFAPEVPNSTNVGAELHGFHATKTDCLLLPYKIIQRGHQEQVCDSHHVCGDQKAGNSPPPVHQNQSMPKHTHTNCEMGERRQRTQKHTGNVRFHGDDRQTIAAWVHSCVQFPSPNVFVAAVRDTQPQNILSALNYNSDSA